MFHIGYPRPLCKGDYKFFTQDTGKYKASACIFTQFMLY